MPIGRWLDTIGASSHAPPRRAPPRDPRSPLAMLASTMAEEVEEKPQPYARKKGVAKGPSILRRGGSGGDAQAQAQAQTRQTHGHTDTHRQTHRHGTRSPSPFPPHHPT